MIFQCRSSHKLFYMHKGFLVTGSALAGIAVILGAFGAHGLKKLVPAETVSTFETGVRYQVYHAFALILVGILAEKFNLSWMTYAGYAFMTGILLFSGSLYVLTALKATGTVGLSGIGIITPIGGLFFVTGWILMVMALLRTN